MSRRRTRSARDGLAVLYVAALVVLAAIAAWPIYRSAHFALLVAVAAPVGIVLAACARRWRWPIWLTAVGVAAAFLALAVPLAVPTMLTGPLAWVQGLGQALRGVVFGWKDLVTVELPVGGYRNLLVPALVVFLVFPTVALLLAWRRGVYNALAVVVAISMVSFGLLFGRPVTSAPVTVGPLVVVAPVELATTAAALVASVLWLSWCTYDDRAQALARAAIASGVRMSRARRTADVRRRWLGAVLVVAPVAVGVLVAPAVAQGLDRTVLRSGIDPQVAVAAAASPLAEYRTAFRDDRFGEALFRVDVVDEPLPERIRLATLTHYDGEVFRVADPAAYLDDTTFTRVPAHLPGADGTPVAAKITVAALRGIWLPTVAGLREVGFEGERAAALADGFYYSAAGATGIDVAGVDADDAYVLRGVDEQRPELTEISAPGATADVEVPESVRTWVRRHTTDTGGAALAKLIALLRERGYLSHALTDRGTEPAAWTTALEGYRFEPSASGHSLARIGEMFEDLLDREQRVRAGETPVAAVGDDEQFAVAAALIAQELGFPARVVVGFRLDAAAGLPACADGVCRGGDLTAWTEVLAATGDWVPVDVTPQHTVGIESDASTQRDPQNPTRVRPEVAEAVDPPPPVQQDAADDPAAPADAAADLTALWTGLRIAGAVLLVIAALAAPAVTIVVAKGVRRRARRDRSQPIARIAGGWEEYLDAAVDAGLEPPRTQTRSELAAMYDTAQGGELARRADAAVFGDAADESEAAAFWTIVDEERRALARGRGLWRRTLAALSLRSFTRFRAAASARRATGDGERRTRPDPVRSRSA